MNLSENLKKIRKDNNLSQEALAEKLGVSRQSVSKWESGLAYPEMDKVIQLCNMFNVNIDELLNQNISEIEKNNNSKVNVNKYINECFDFVTKVVKTISSMKFWSLVKCVIEQIFIFLILWFIKTVIANFIVEPLIRIISIFTDKINSIIYNVGFSIYELGMAVIIFAVMVHIFKIRYMDYYLKGIENEEEKLDEIKNEDKKEIKEEKIIVRDPKHSGDNIFTLLGKGILFIIKLFVLFIGIPFCFSLVGFAFLFIISFLFVKTGYLFLGGFLGLIGCIIINMLILYVIIYFVLNKKINPILLIISFFTSLILGGIGIGLILIGVKDFTYLDSYDGKYITKQEQIIKIDKDYYLPYNDNNIKYIETNSKEVKIVYEYPNICKFDNGDNYNYPICDNNDFNNKVIDYYLESLNNKVFINPDYFKVNVYASKDNIKKLIENKNKYYENLKKKDEQIKKESQSNIN